MQALSNCNCREVSAARPSVQRPQRLVCQAAAREPQQQQRQQLASLPLLVAGFAAAALLGAGDAEAKVKFQQPEKPARQLFQKDPNAPKPPQPEKVVNKAKEAGKGFGLPSFSAPSLPSGPKEVAGGIDARTVALPGAVAGIVGLGFGLTKLDPGFGKVLQETVIKDSNDYAGYEEILKSGADAIGQGARGRAGTKRMKQACCQEPKRRQGRQRWWCRWAFGWTPGQEVKAELLNMPLTFWTEGSKGFPSPCASAHAVWDTVQMPAVLAR